MHPLTKSICLQQAATIYAEAAELVANADKRIQQCGYEPENNISGILKHQALTMKIMSQTHKAESDLSKLKAP